jgi:hypothetical protein
VNTVMNLQVPKKAGNFLLHEVSQSVGWSVSGSNFGQKT